MRTVGNRIILGIDVVSIAIGCYGLARVNTLVLPLELKDAGHWQFLTNISLALSLIIFSLGVVGHVTKNESVYQFKNWLHAFGFVLEIMVTTVYWPLRLFFLNLLVRDAAKFNAPLLTDLSIHLMPFVSLGIDYFLFMPSWTISTQFAFWGCIALTSSYWMWLHYLIDFEKGGVFPYNFLNVDNTVLRGAIFATLGLYGFGNFMLMKHLYRRFAIQKEIELEEESEVKRR